MLDRLALHLMMRLDRRMIWRTPSKDAVHLTFDDGPHPELTPWVLDTLSAHGAKASFFCLGENASKHPAIVQRLRAEGHTVGHHTWGHPDGWRTPRHAYLRNVLQGAHAIGEPWFRAPYGRLPRRLIPLLRKRYRLVMWDVMAGDFLPGRSSADCARHVLRHARPGSIIVLHDNAKSGACLRGALVPILEGLSEKGFRCTGLAEAINSP